MQFCSENACRRKRILQYFQEEVGNAESEVRGRRGKPTLRSAAITAKCGKGMGET